jgi:hypothetical protein
MGLILKPFFCFRRYNTGGEMLILVFIESDIPRTVKYRSLGQELPHRYSIAQARGISEDEGKKQRDGKTQVVRQGRTARVLAAA